MTEKLRPLLLAAAFAVCPGGVLLPKVGLADEAPIAFGQQANGKIRADILSLKRTEGDTVTVRFAIVNNGNQTLSMTLGNMKLIDLVNRRSYAPGVTSPSCRTEAGERSICWAVFAAPGAATKTINVQFYENFELISAAIAD
jgi:hypothetical protein